MERDEDDEEEEDLLVFFFSFLSFDPFDFLFLLRDYFFVDLFLSKSFFSLCFLYFFYFFVLFSKEDLDEELLELEELWLLDDDLDRELDLFLLLLFMSFFLCLYLDLWRWDDFEDDNDTEREDDLSFLWAPRDLLLICFLYFEEIESERYLFAGFLFLSGELSLLRAFLLNPPLSRSRYPSWLLPPLFKNNGH